jgi:glycosyltransferase involved in cell wall biosynthesis
VARLFERKRPGDALAIHERLTKLKDYRTVFVGNGPMEDALKQQAGKNKRIHFLGFQDQQRLAKLITAPIFCFCPRNLRPATCRK